MDAGFQLFKDDETPLYIQAARAVRARILDGELRPGDRLPSVRGLSDELGVNPATVVAAYRILTREGYILAKAGSGAYVARDAPVEGRADEPDPAAPASERPLADGASGTIDLAANAPPLDMFPLEDMKRFIVEAIDADGGKAFEYQDTGGYRPLRVAIVITSYSIHYTKLYEPWLSYWALTCWTWDAKYPPWANAIVITSYSIHYTKLYDDHRREAPRIVDALVGHG